MEEYDKKIFATNLNKYMLKTNTKQADIGNLLGVGKSTVSSWCNAKKIPRMDKVQRLANHFGIMKSDLIEEKPIAVSDDGLTDEERALIQAYRNAPVEIKRAINKIARD